MRTERVAREQRELWHRALDLQLMTPGLLATVPARRQRAGELFDTLVAPGLGPFADTLATPCSPEAIAARSDFARMAAATELMATGIYQLHSTDQAHQEATSHAAIWLVIASAVVDQKVDDGELLADEVRQRCNPTAFLAALEPDGPPLIVPGQPLLERLLANATTAMRARVQSATTPFDRAVGQELQICIRDMISGQLDSEYLRIHPLSDLAEVERTLRRVNTLTTWIHAHLGLFGARGLADETLRSVRQITTRVSDVAWALDALSDIHQDLAAGLWNLVWLELARETGTSAPWLLAFHDDPDLALDALAASSVATTLLSRIALSILEIRHAPAVDPTAAAALAELCVYMVWSYLSVAEP